jgi:hypothetical protein
LRIDVLGFIGPGFKASPRDELEVFVKDQGMGDPEVRKDRL